MKAGCYKHWLKTQFIPFYMESDNIFICFAIDEYKEKHKSHSRVYLNFIQLEIEKILKQKGCHTLTAYLSVKCVENDKEYHKLQSRIQFLYDLAEKI